MTPVSYQLRVYGNVHAVGYRRYVQAKAQELGIIGLVRNQPDGTVYIEIAGGEPALQQFIQWCREGSPTARVSKVKVAKAEPKHYPNFEIY